MFGAGAVGLRPATGLPVLFLLSGIKGRRRRPIRRRLRNEAAVRVLPDVPAMGDPLNANVPGTPDDPGIYHWPILRWRRRT